MINLFKKILIVFAIIGVVAVIGFVALGYGTYKVADEALKEKEPQLRQYLQMDEAAQNKYVLDNIIEVSAKVDLDKDGKPEDKEKFERFLKLNAQPDIQKALVDVGRSLMASAIILSEPIVNDMTPDIKAKYEKEAEDFETRTEKYKKLIEAADPSLVEDK